MTDEELMIDAINHLRAAVESISKLRTSSLPLGNKPSSLNSGGSPVSILAERCRNGIGKCREKLTNAQTLEFGQNICAAEHNKDTKTLNLILGQLLKLYKS